MAYPNVAATSKSTITSNGEFTVTLPAGSTEGDLIIVFMSFGAGTTATASTTTGWTLLTGTSAIYARVLTSGSPPPLTFTLDGPEAYQACLSYGCLRYDGTGIVFDVAESIAFAGPVYAYGGSVDCPNLAHGWGVGEWSWIVADLIRVNVYASYLTYPAGFSNDEVHTYGDSDGGGSLGSQVAVVTLDDSVESKNPGTFDHRYGYTHINYAYTMAVRAIPDVEITSGRIGIEFGFNAGTELVVPADQNLYMGRIGIEFAFKKGTRLVVPTKRQVPLVGGGLWMPDRTIGGTEGQVLTQHDNVPPTWETPSAAGEQGETGPPGADGSLWFAQSAEPVANQTGDLWLDSDNGNIYQWDGDSWELIANYVPTGYYEPVIIDGEIVVTDNDIVMMWVEL